MDSDVGIAQCMNTLPNYSTVVVVLWGMWLEVAVTIAMHTGIAGGWWLLVGVA